MKDGGRRKASGKQRKGAPSFHFSIRKVQVIHCNTLPVDWVFLQSEEDINAGKNYADNEVVVREFDVARIEELWEKGSGRGSVVRLWAYCLSSVKGDIKV
jgi:hypothetical protein